MCGISGIALANQTQDREWLLNSSELIKHRGPDSSGEWWSKDGRLGLAHKRLAIIDLSKEANQPMTYSLGSMTIVFNGEIYNYVALRESLKQKGYAFETSSDTEVLLKAYHCWGSKSLKYLEGMFAFAIFDENKKKLFLARDRAGEKPLYYFYNGSKFLFCSELKGLLEYKEINRNINPTAFDCFLSMGFVPGESCIIDGVKKLSPGNFLEYKFNENLITISKYWDLPIYNSARRKIDDEELVYELESLLSNSIERQLIADVPVGILLSGGVDSSLIAALAAKSKNKVKTFNVRFSDHIKYDESRHARLIANSFGTEHIEIDAKDISVDLLSRLALQYDEPIADSSMIPTHLVCETVKKYCTVALGGDGGDELFGGYNHYSRMLRLQKYLSLFPNVLKRLIKNTSKNLLPLGFKGRNWLLSVDQDINFEIPFISNLFDVESRSLLVQDYLSLSENAESIRKQNIIITPDLLERATKLDFKLYLAEDLLVKIDRASMLNSLELRSPFLDKKIIEFAYGCVPSNLKSNSYQKKILLKKLCKNILPAGFDLSRKQGFSVPIGEWIKKGSWLEHFEAVLYDKETIFNRKFVKGLINNQKKGYNNTERIFALVMFEKWRREYNINL